MSSFGASKFGTVASNNATAAAVVTAAIPESTRTDTLYSDLDMSIVSECIGMDLPTYLIRQQVATKRETLKREFQKTLMASFTLSSNCAPWEELPKVSFTLYGYVRTHEFQFVQVRKDVWKFMHKNAASSFSSYPVNNSLSVDDWLLRYEGVQYYSPDKGMTSYTSKTAYYQYPIVDMVERYSKVVESYQKQVQQLHDWEAECLAICHAKAEQLPSIDLRNCFSQIWGMTMPSPMDDIVEPKKVNVCSKLAEELNKSNTLAENDVYGKQMQQTHLETEIVVIDLLTDGADENTTANEKRRPTCDQGTNHEIQRPIKQRRLLEEIELLKNITRTSSPIESMNQPKKVVIALNNPTLNVEALFLDRPTHTELLTFINQNTLTCLQKFGKGSFLVKCLQTLYNTIECDKLDVPTRYQIMIAHLALRLFDFISCDYVDKYRKWIGANDIWASEANLSTLETASRSTIIWVKNNTPSVFLTNSSVQELFQKVLTVDDNE